MSASKKRARVESEAAMAEDALSRVSVVAVPWMPPVSAAAMGGSARAAGASRQREGRQLAQEEQLFALSPFERESLTGLMDAELGGAAAGGAGGGGGAAVDIAAREERLRRARRDAAFELRDLVQWLRLVSRRAALHVVYTYPDGRTTARFMLEPEPREQEPEEESEEELPCGPPIRIGPRSADPLGKKK